MSELRGGSTVGGLLIETVKGSIQKNAATLAAAKAYADTKVGSEATTTAAGLMSAADKTKLNGIAASANNYSLPVSTASVLGGVKTGTNITNSSGTISVADASTSVKGVVQLSAAINSTSATLAATASAVKTVNDSLTTHTGNTTVHITAAERTVWNDAKDRNFFADTRNAASLPSFYRAKGTGVFHEFKNPGSLSLTTDQVGGTYCHVDTTVPYTDKSGGPVKQIVMGYNNIMYIRTGSTNDDSWGAWDQLMTMSKVQQMIDDLRAEVQKAIFGQ